jgi:RNA polymerase primary sigma factor
VASGKLFGAPLATGAGGVDQMKKDILAVVHLPASAALAPDEQMQAALGALGERERVIVELRFGLKDGRRASLQELGQQFGVTAERVRQIEARAIGKLRRWAQAGRLAPQSLS